MVGEFDYKFFSQSIMRMFKWYICEDTADQPFLDGEECPAILDLLRPCENYPFLPAQGIFLGKKECWCLGLQDTDPAVNIWLIEGSVEGTQLCRHTTTSGLCQNVNNRWRFWAEICHRKTDKCERPTNAVAVQKQISCNRRRGLSRREGKLALENGSGLDKAGDISPGTGSANV